MEADSCPSIDTRVMCRSALRSSTARNSASLRSVMSTATPSIWWLLPFSARPRAAIQRTLPSGTGTRYSTSNSSPVATAFLHGAPEMLAVRRVRRLEDLVEGDRRFVRVAGASPRIRVAGDSVRRYVPYEHREPRCGRREIHLLLGLHQRTRRPAPRSRLQEQRGDQSSLEQQDRRIRARSRANTGPTRSARGT